MSSVAKRQHFNKLAPQWDQLPHPEDAWPKVEEFVGRAWRTNPTLVLDAGCGTGILLPYVLKASPPVRRVVELDFAEGMLRENARKVGDPRVARLCADAHTLPFLDACFDLVLCFGVLPHLADLPAALAGLWRVLRPSGVLTVGHLMSSTELNAFHQSMGEPVARDHLPPAESLAQMLRQLEGTVVAAEDKPGWYFVEVQKAPV
jgi:ubiquinone/menaquinone biosynthesis C-methylase UbiE